jgi:hypothetical protein
MKSDVAYKTTTDKISVHKMQFTVTHRRPKFTEKDKQTAKREVEKLLFEVFSKHE